MPKLYVLVGVPGSGKTTWVNDYDRSTNCSYVSTDMWVEREAARVGSTYSDIFNDYMPTAVKFMTYQVTAARDKGMDIIWDQTSTTVKSRSKKFRMLPKYYKIAIVFRTPEREELNRRLAGRIEKNIPIDVIDSMIAGWEEPTIAEGFDEIIYVD